MRSCIRFFLFLFLLVSCQNERKDNAYLSNASISRIDGAKKKITTIRKWLEYKKVPVFDINDTIPYSGCFIVVKQDSFFYFRYNKMYENRLLVLTKKNLATVYTFKNKRDDLLIFSSKNNEYALLKRNNFEGEYEYFKLSE